MGNNFFKTLTVQLIDYNEITSPLGNLSPVEYSTENIQHIQKKGKFASLTNKQARILLQNQIKPGQSHLIKTLRLSYQSRDHSKKVDCSILV